MFSSLENPPRNKMASCRRNNLLRDKMSLYAPKQPSNLVTAQDATQGWNHSNTKRIIGALLAALMLLALTPLMIPIAIAIKITSKGPIFFLQDRTGYLGRRFKMYKFRTMTHDAEQLKAQLAHLNHHQDGSPDFKVKNDPRITRIGGFLRKYSLDELPQLINVVKGDMRLVGPRPTSFDISKYADNHFIRLGSPPGITGMWQISGRSNLDFDQRTQLDSDYLINQSPLQDIKILLKTPLVVLKGEGAY
jgi:lipopolysaccharide/colanic/teichoic acid biosynthesis glycosyltransferase